MTTKLDNIKKSLTTNFDEFLNKYYEFLLKSKNTTIIVEPSTVRKDVIALIKLLDKERISRVPYDSITGRVNEFNEIIDETSDEFDFFIQATSEALKEIVEDFVNNQTFDGEEVLSDDKSKLENAVYAFYKILEHTKLADVQYKSLYKKTEEEVQELRVTSKKAIAESKELRQISRELKSKYTNLNIEIISVLGIFSSIIFAIFGGVSQLGRLSENLNRICLGKIFIFIGSSSFLLFSALFIAFNTTAHLTDRNMKSCCNNIECSHKVYKKYPIYFLSIIISISMIVFGIIFYLYC